MSFGAYDRTKTYEGLSCGQTIALPGSDFTGREPSFNATYTFLGWSKRAGATSIDEAAGDIPASATTMAVDGDAGYYAVYRTLGDKLPITFTGMHEADGSGAPDITVRIPGGTTLKDSGAQQVTPADYSADGVTYRFVGWNVSCVDLTVYSYDPASLYEDFTFAADNTSATCTAVYVPVAPGQHLVTFKVQHGVAAYAVDDGISPNFEACYNSNDVCVPALIETTSGYTATYKGWSAGYDRSNKYDEGMQCYTGPLPKADADVTYTARYDYSVTKRTMNFYTYKEAVEGGYAYAGTKVERVDWTLDGIIEANKIVKPGDTFDYERRTYTFLGWSTRLSDKEPLYTDTLLVNSTPSSDGATSFFGIYSIGTRTITVNYYDHGELYAQATKQIPEASIGSALHSTGLEPPTPANPAGQFRGWSTEEGAASTLTDATQLSELSGDEDVVNLYAVYYEGGAMVRFYDDDHKTLLYDVEVKRGYTVDAYAHETNESILAKVGMKRDLFRAWVTEDGQIFSLTDTQVVGDFDVFATYVQESAGTGKADTSGIKIDVGGLGGVRVNVNTARLASAASAASGAASAAADAAETAEATAASVDASGIGGDGDGMAAGAEASPVAGEIGGIIFFAVLVALLIAAIAGLLLFFLKRRKKDEEEAVSFVPAELESIRF